MKQIRYICACIALAFCLTGISQAESSVYIANWGEIKTTPALQIAEGTPSSLMAKSYRNDLAACIERAGMEKESYYLVLDREKAHARFAIITEQTAGPLALKRLGLVKNYPLFGMDDKTLIQEAAERINANFKTLAPSQYVLESPFTLYNRKGTIYAEGVLSYGDIVNGAVHNDRIYIAAYPKNGRIQIMAVIGSAKDAKDVLEPLFEKIKNRK